MGKIVVIDASPRENGNCSTILGRFLKGSMYLATNEIKYYHLSNMVIHDCKACMHCKSNKKCIQEDDVNQILDDLSDCSALVVSVPVYFNGPNGAYKIVEDRLYSLIDADLKSRIAPGKSLFIICSCSGPIKQALQVIEHIKETFAMLGFVTADTFPYSDLGSTKPASMDDEILLRAERSGKSLRNVYRNYNDDEIKKVPKTRLDDC